MGQTDCRLYLRVSPGELKKFKFFQENGYSAREIFENIQKEIPVTIVSKKTGEPLQIPPNILSKRRK